MHSHMNVGVAEDWSLLLEMLSRKDYSKSQKPLTQRFSVTTHKT
jgi:hypothetical protein